MTYVHCLYVYNGITVIINACCPISLKILAGNQLDAQFLL